MASSDARIQIEPTPELSAALDRAEALRKPFDYDTLHPIAMQAAQIVSEYYYALIKGQLPPVVIDNLVYDFHRIVWAMPSDNE